MRKIAQLYSKTIYCPFHYKPYLLFCYNHRTLRKFDLQPLLRIGFCVYGLSYFINDTFRWHTHFTDEISPTESHWNNCFIHPEGNAMKIIFGGL